MGRKSDKLKKELSFCYFRKFPFFFVRNSTQTFFSIAFSFKKQQTSLKIFRRFAPDLPTPTYTRIGLSVAHALSNQTTPSRKNRSTFWHLVTYTVHFALKRSKLYSFCYFALTWVVFTLKNAHCNAKNSFWQNKTRFCYPSSFFSHLAVSGKRSFYWVIILVGQKFGLKLAKSIILLSYHFTEKPL